MRLINTSTLKLHEFSVAKIPPYAILSHTWGDDEVTFDDMSRPDRSLKKGYAKITETCRLALEHDLLFAWVDTCCIDKSSSAELTESINSMFHWYKNARVCYVFLEDLQPDITTECGLPFCRWLTRGWTLQELLAPKTVEFYDSAWSHRGSKLDLSNIISRYTGIRIVVVEQWGDLARLSVAERMSWAAKRETSRVEDIAYCLLGIFNVNMPLIYGERLHAFRRLQEEIVKRNNDLTIFAWDVPHDCSCQALCLFASSPAAFIGSSFITPFRDDDIDFSVTNNGLLISGDIPMRTVKVAKIEDGYAKMRYAVFLGSDIVADEDGGLYLRKVGPKLFYRDGRLPLGGFGSNEVEQVEVFDMTDYYIVIDPNIAKIAQSSRAFRHGAVHVPLDEIFRLEETVPTNLWDITDRVFLKPNPYNWTRYSMVLAMSFSGELAGEHVRIVVLCDGRGRSPTCMAFVREKHRPQADMIFKGRYKNEPIFWADLEIQAPQLFALNNVVEICVEDVVFDVSITFELRMEERISMKAAVFSLQFTTVQRSKE